MRAHRHYCTVATCCSLTVLLVGCRGSQPRSSLVRISNETVAELPEIQAPPQRLATARPRSEAASELEPVSTGVVAMRIPKSTAPPNPSAKKHMTTTLREPADGNATTADSDDATMERIRESLAMLESSRPATRSARQPTSHIESPASDKQSDHKPTDEQAPKSIDNAESAATDQLAATGPATTAKSPRRPAIGDANADSPARPGLTEATLPAITPEELADAFTASSPEVQAMALRQLVERSTQKAERSTHPAAINEALLALLDDVKRRPDLMIPDPAANATPLAAKPSAGSANKDESVQPVSAIREADEIPLVSQAGSLSESVASATADGPTTASEELKATAGPEDDSQRVAEVAVDQMSDEVLLETLAKRFAEPGADESEANRNRRAIVKRLLMLMSTSIESDEAIPAVTGLTEAEQSYLQHQFRALATIIDPDGHPVPERRFTMALPHLREAAKYLAACTDSLDVRSLAFCTEIQSYGQIKEFAGNRFRPGQQVILYCEIDNFAARSVAVGYETELQGNYNIYNSENRKVVSQLLPVDKQTTQTYLRDYFIAYQMHLPQQLAVGTYRLELTMEDVAGKKYGQASIPFEITE